MAELFNQLFTKNNGINTPIFPNLKFIEVENIEGTTNEYLTSNYGEYNLVVDVIQHIWFFQYDSGKWING